MAALRSLPALLQALLAVDSQNTADDVFVEPSENILGGEVGASGCNVTHVSETPVAPVVDPANRIVTGPIVNGNGLTVEPCLFLGDGSEPAIAEGYYGELLDANSNPVKTFFYFLMEAEPNGAVANRGGLTTYEVSITRARCRNGDEIRIQGGVNVGDGTVTLTGFGFQPETVAVILDPVTGQGTYSHRGNIGTCPSEITATCDMGDGGDMEASVTADVSIR